MENNIAKSAYTSFVYVAYVTSTVSVFVRWDFQLRDAIARSFGFIPCIRNSQLRRQDRMSNMSWSAENQYIHYTGNMFLLIPTGIRLQIGIQGIAAPTPEVEDRRKDNLTITRSLSKQEPIYDHSKTGFLWSWNFMISRKWKQLNSSTGAFALKFCDFW